MHDLHEADKILKTVLKYSEKNGLKTIKKIAIELGTIIEHGEEINAENLKFNINLLAKGTAAEKTKIAIKKTNQFNGWKLVEIEGI